MLVRFALKHPKKFWPMGIHISDDKLYWEKGACNDERCAYTIPRGENFSVHNNEDVEHVIKVPVTRAC